MGIRVALILALCLLLNGPLTAQADNSGARELFGDFTGLSADMMKDGGAAHPTIVRRRPVHVHSHLVSHAQGSQADALPTGPLQLNLFPDVSHTAIFDRLDRNPSGSQSWVGHIPEQPMSQVVIVSHDGMVAGNISMPGAFYQIRYEGGGIHSVREIDQSKFPEHDDVAIPTDLPQGDESTNPGSMRDDGSVVDVMVVYTQSARSAVGGTSAMGTLIDLAITETNASYSNSGINHRLRLVHKAEVDYTEKGFSADLNNVTGTSDGYMDEIHALRDQYGADQVSLLINDSSSCGLGWLMTSVSSSFKTKAFTVTHHDCATGYYSFGHEIGHNMGARHDRYADNTDTPYTTSHGYVNVSSKWRTVMAYNDKCAAAGTSCTRIQYWSTPSATYQGSALGIAEGSSSAADNRTTLNKTAYTMANFRDSVSTATTTTTTSSLSCTSGALYSGTLPDGSAASICLGMKKVTTPSGQSKLRGSASTSWRGFASTATNATGSTFTFAWENYESDSATGTLYENNPAQGALFILAYAFASGNCNGGASFFAVVETLNAASLTSLGNTITVTPLFGQICGSAITTLNSYTLTKQ